MIKTISDLESMIKGVKAYLMEEVTLENESVMWRINHYIALKNAEKGDEILEPIVEKETRFLIHERRKDFNGFESWIDISGGEDVEHDTNFDRSARIYIVSLSSLIRDNFSDDVFFQSIRMAEVLTDAMLDFFKIYQVQGLMQGRIEKSSVPVRAKAKGQHVLKSNVMYIATVQ